MKKFMNFFLLIPAISMVMSGCRKDDSKEPFPDPTNGAQVQATISGRVIDENNNPVSGVSVTAYGLNATTDYHGIFLLEGSVNKDRCVIEFTKAGFLKRLHAIIPQTGKVNYVRIVLNTQPLPQTISSSAGGSVTLGVGGSVQFQANSFVIEGSTTPYTGSVDVMATYLSPGNPNFGLMIPGGDLAGENATGDEVALYSYGMADVILTGAGGEALQLASGTTATITFPIASAQLGSAPSTIPLWYFDETDALWKEEGQATKTGNNYVGSVSHFSTWNCDYSGPRAYVNGYVVDCEGTPLANVVVTVNGGVTVTTDGNGYYTLWVPSGWPLTFQVLPHGAIFLPSQMENVAALATGQVYTVPDLVVPCGSYITGNFSDCENQPTEGSIVVLYNGDVVNFEYSENGSFRIMVPSIASVTLSIGAQTGLSSQTVTTLAAGDSLNVGTIQLCNDVTSSFSFKINGAAYNNVTVNMLNFTSNEGAYYTNWDHTVNNISGFTNLGQLSASISFEGNQPVNLDLSSATDSSFNIYFDNQYYFPADLPDHFYLNVTQYGAVGDSIKGTFYGKLVSFSNPAGVMITDGKFACIRGLDQ